MSDGPQNDQTMPVKPWKQRVAEELARGKPTPEAVECALEAYAEMRLVKLKVLLARCYEIISTAKLNGDEPKIDDDFAEILLEASE